MTVLLAAPALSSKANASEECRKPDWQCNIDWAEQNVTGPDQLNCPDQYTYVAPQCIFSGGRACVIGYARAAAALGYTDQAFRLALLTQCHNPDARRTIDNAGAERVASYLLNR